jgi:hypothetical protein
MRDIQRCYPDTDFALPITIKPVAMKATGREQHGI